MTWQAAPAVWLQAGVGLVDVALIGLLWRDRTVPGGRAMLAALFAFAWWSACGALEWAVVDATLTLALRNLAYVAITAVPALLLVFGLEYTGRGAGLRSYYKWLLVEPLVVQVLVWTNPLHGWHYAYSEVVTQGGLQVVQAAYGPAFWGHAVYSYLLMIAGVALVVVELTRATRLYRWQVGLVLGGMLIPWVSNVLYLMGAFELGGADPAPVASTLMAAVVTWALRRYRFMDVLPVAQERIVDGMREGVVVVEGTRPILVNPAARRILDLEGASEPDRPPLPAVLVEALGDWDDGARGEAEVELPAGASTRSYLLRQMPVRRGGDARLRLLMLIDIQDYKETQRVLQRRKAEAESANRAKSEFVANMSHELRTPLNAILGYARLVGEDSGLATEHRHAVTTIEQSGEHLLRLINEILDLSKVDAGAERVVAEAFELAQLVSGVAGMFELSCARRGLAWHLETQIPPGNVVGDHGKLRQVLINLLGNAVKFTEEGQVVLGVVNDGDTYRFTVSDTGPGIPEERHEAVFEPFQQEELGRQRGGTGLGLAIARRHVELMGGRLRLDSAPGQGTRVTFGLHLPSAARVEPAPVPATDGADEAAMADGSASLPVSLPAYMRRDLQEAVRAHDLTGLRRTMERLRGLGAAAEALERRLQGPARRFDMDGMREVLQAAGLLED